MHGFIRVGSALPKCKLADCTYNKDKVIQILQQASEKQIQVLVFPELSITTYSCGDLFFQSSLLSHAKEGLASIVTASQKVDIFIVVGLPLAIDNQIFNCAVALYKGCILGIVPKSCVPNYGEFYEKRWFAPATQLLSKEICLCEQRVPIGADLIFSADKIPDCKIGIEICEDLWSPIPPSSYQAISGATILLNPSASNELATKYDYRKQLIGQQSSRCIAAYVYSSAGVGESTQDMVFSGHGIIYENGTLLKESKRFLRETQLIYADIDVEALGNDRRKNSTFMQEAKQSFREISFSMEPQDIEELERTISAQPFIPSHDLESRCQDIFNIQVVGLARRIEHTKANCVVVGISGGLDSTLALLVSVKACDYLGIAREHVIGVTMPGFGTTDRTYQNALSLMEALGVQIKEIFIQKSVLQHFEDIGHDASKHDTTYENAQARERTQILMDIANKENGFVVGTGDLSELALGWATYNGDHMSMYGVNAGIPKTLIRVLVRWISNSLSSQASTILLDILDTPVSPELLPPDEKGNINQKTEEIVGPYELHDFFLYYVVRYGFSPSKILFLAEHAFHGEYERTVLLKWLKNFYHRFFTQQFKRSCMPDGPKVGTISLSPRGDWRMPSDAFYHVWMEEIEKL